MGKKRAPTTVKETGERIIQMPEGLQATAYPDQHQEIALPNGYRVVCYRSGHKTVVYPDGRKASLEPDPKYVTIYYPDGHFEATISLEDKPSEAEKKPDAWSDGLASEHPLRVELVARWRAATTEVRDRVNRAAWGLIFGIVQNITPIPTAPSSKPHTPPALDAATLARLPAPVDHICLPSPADMAHIFLLLLDVVENREHIRLQELAGPEPFGGWGRTAFQVAQIRLLTHYANAMRETAMRGLGIWDEPDTETPAKE